MDAAPLPLAVPGADSRVRAFTPSRDLFYPVAMGEVVNLNRVKKARANADAAATAAVNRAKHGRGGAERANDRRAEARRQALLDGARQEHAPADPPPTEIPGTDPPA
jgi:Domain of unknown function (DUF4169)